MALELIEPRGGTVKSSGPPAVMPKSDIVREESYIEFAPILTQTYYFVVEFPEPVVAYEEPDTETPVTLSDLQAISRHHAVADEGIDPDPGLPRGWH